MQDPFYRFGYYVGTKVAPIIVPPIMWLIVHIVPPAYLIKYARHKGWIE